jgi:hypothetical protein
MTRHDHARMALAISAVALVALFPGQAQGAGRLAVDLLAQQGFGDRQNTMVWSGAWFKGSLYVGTQRSTVCVENQTVDFYLPVLRRYRSTPLPSVRCTPNPYALDLRAEIWRYTPRTRSWKRVYRSPQDIPNPRSRGKFLARDIGYRGMVVHRDRRGRQALFVGGVTSDEYVPEISRRHPPRLLRTYDGVHFKNLGAPAVVRRRGGYTDHRPIGFRALMVWKHRLLVTATPGLTGDGAIFVVRHPFARRVHRVRFRQITDPRWQVFEMQTFKGRLYAGLGSKAGYSIYRTRETSPRRRLRWLPIVIGGAGRGASIASVVSMKVFRNKLYVGSNGWFKQDELPASELIRIRGDDRWTLVAGNPRRSFDGVARSPVSGLRDGFENMFNAHFWRMETDRGALYVGTNDWSYLVQVDKRFPVLQSLLAGEFGFDLWASCDGTDWFPVTRNAFGGNMYDFGARTLVPSRAGLFVGSANSAHGVKVWRDRTPACSSLVGSHVRAAAARSSTAATPPRHLLTDVQPHGTVISWESPTGGSPASARQSPPPPSEPAAPGSEAAPAPEGDDQYRILRAEFQGFFGSLVMPPLLPGGFGLESQTPIPGGYPGASSRATEFSVHGPMTQIGTTRRSFFVDRTARPGLKYLYQVVAKTPSGAVSPSSNVQVVPDPRPPVTFRMLEQQLRGAGVARAGVARTKWRHRDRRGTLAALAHLQRALREDDDRRQTIDRLARQIRYAGVAGGR